VADCELYYILFQISKRFSRQWPVSPWTVQRFAPLWNLWVKPHLQNLVLHQNLTKT